MAPSLLSERPFKPSPEFLSKYTLGEQLGKGGFGSVYACTDKKTGKLLACKVLNREHVRQAIGVEPSKELGIMQQLANQHFGVIQLLDAFEDEVNAYAVMEHCSGGSLLDVLKKHGAMPEKSAKVVLGQVAAALAFCHSKRVLHLDIKPENIFFCESPVDALYGGDFSCLKLSSLFSSLEVRARLADFGMSTVLKVGKKVRGDVGSPHFKAPEIVSGQRFGLEVDVWSLGVVLSVMLTGTVPFLGNSNHDTPGLNKAIMSGLIDFNSARWWGVSEDAKNLVRRMLEVDPSKRITAAEVLEHPWFRAAEELPVEEEILPAFALDQVSGSRMAAAQALRPSSRCSAASTKPASAPSSLKATPVKAPPRPAMKPLARPQTNAFVPVQFLACARVAML